MKINPISNLVNKNLSFYKQENKKYTDPNTDKIEFTNADMQYGSIAGTSLVMLAIFLFEPKRDMSVPKYMLSYVGVVASTYACVFGAMAAFKLCKNLIKVTILNRI